VQAPYTGVMEVQFPPDLERKLNRIAAEQGRDSVSLVQEAVERLIHYDEWFLHEVEKGLEAADRGEFVEHEEVGKSLNSRYPG
jgi:predicted transcriptional regulator